MEIDAVTKNKIEMRGKSVTEDPNNAGKMTKDQFLRKQSMERDQMDLRLDSLIRNSGKRIN